jgi:hypothetical protein
MEPSTPDVMKSGQAAGGAAGLVWQRRLYVCCHDTAEASVPASFSVAGLAAFVAGRRGRPAHIATARGWPPWALAWVAGPDADWIISPRAMPPRQRVGAIAHLAAHLLLGHAGWEMDAVMLTEMLFPGLDRALGGTAIASCGLATEGEDHQAQAVMADIVRATAVSGRPVTEPAIA